MAADIHPVALVANGPGDTADLLAGFDQDRFDPRAPLQLQCRGKSGWTRSYDDCRALLHSIASFLKDIFQVLGNSLGQTRIADCFRGRDPIADSVSRAASVAR